VGETGIPRILHLHSGFNLGGKEARAVRLMNVWGRRAHHSVISADHAAMGARKAIAADVPCDFPMEAAPSLNGLPGLARYRRWARYMQRFDLVLTYNWGAMDGVMAHRMFAPFVKLPPLIHHEDGFNEDEAERLKPKRNLFRQLALGSAHALVVPSRVLEDVALGAWAQPRPRIRRIANGIDVAAYAVPPAPGAIPGLGKRAGDVVVGTLAGLRAVKNLPRLVRVVASLGEHVWLAIVGEGPEREAIVAQARALGMEQRLILPGFLPDPARYIGSFDIFALSSDSRSNNGVQGVEAHHLWRPRSLAAGRRRQGRCGDQPYELGRMGGGRRHRHGQSAVNADSYDASNGKIIRRSTTPRPGANGMRN
jgi:glycosyltransferase involved in cell wall biosynthesis